jgi:antitoxin (DNA-binding transcriptional repressor) of toxin-antitoxin stability system
MGGMSIKLITATEAARNFSEVLNKVSEQGASYEVRRGREVVARLVPAHPLPRRISVAELAELLRRLPALEPGDGPRFEKDLAAARRRLRPPRDPWA